MSAQSLLATPKRLSQVVGSSVLMLLVDSPPWWQATQPVSPDLSLPNPQRLQQACDVEMETKWE
jgi:hypothetical protein